MQINADTMLQKMTFNQTNWSFETKCWVGLGAAAGVGALIVGIAMGAGAFGEHLTFSSTEPLHFVAKTLTVTGGLITVSLVVAGLFHHVRKNECIDELRKELLIQEFRTELTEEKKKKLSTLEEAFETGVIYQYVTKTNKHYSICRTGNHLEITLLGTGKVRSQILQSYHPVRRQFSLLEKGIHLSIQALQFLSGKMDRLTAAERKLMKEKNIPFCTIWLDDKGRYHYFFIWHDGRVATASEEDIEDYKQSLLSANTSRTLIDQPMIIDLEEDTLGTLWELQNNVIEKPEPSDSKSSLSEQESNY